MTLLGSPRGLLVQVSAKLLGAFHVALNALDDEPLLSLVLLVLQTDGEAAQGVAVEGQGLVVVAVIVCRYGAGDDFNGVGNECVLHLGEMDLFVDASIQPCTRTMNISGEEAGGA